MYGTVEFLQLPGSLSTGTYPLLSSASADLTEYTLNTQTMKYTVDFVQSLQALYFDNFEVCNAVRMYGLIYWVTSVRTATDTDRSLTFDVEINAPSSVLHKNSTVQGAFSRLPYNVCPYLQQQVMSGAMRPSRFIDLPMLETASDGRQVFWVQITSTVELPVSTGQPFTLEQIRQLSKQDVLTTYGCFVKASRDLDTMWPVFYGAVGSNVWRYPSLQEVVSDLDSVMGIPASSITDISISIRCPYEYSYVYGDQETARLTVSSATQYPVAVTAGGFTRCLYEFTGSFSPVSEKGTVSISLSGLERACGSVTLRNQATGTVGEIPTAWGSSMSGSVQCIADYNGMATRITIADTVFMIPEGHLPYIGSSWEEYKAYSMALDREAMQSSIDFAQQRVILGIADSIAGSVTGGAMGAAVAGGPAGIAMAGASLASGIISSVLGRQIEEAETRTAQELTEKRMRAAAGTPYNVGYGLMYVAQCWAHPACIQVDMPAGLTQTIFNGYADLWGYPAENFRSVTVQEGYFKGMVTSLTGSPLVDAMNLKMMNGIRFKEV